MTSHLRRSVPILLLPLAGRAVAQRPAGVETDLVIAEHRVDVGSGVERTRGPVFGVGAMWNLAEKWQLEARVAGGTLHGSGGVMDRKLAEVGLQGGYQATSWLVLHAALRRRVYANDVVRQAWTTVALGGEGRLPLLGGATGLLSGSVSPSVAVRGLPAPDAAVAAGAGMEYHLGLARLIVRYDLERYDFPKRNGVPHLEQLAAFTLRVELHRRASGTGS